jgi:hypothetical protein
MAKTTCTVTIAIQGGEIIQTSTGKTITIQANLLVLANNKSSLNKTISLSHKENSKEPPKALT